MRSLAPGFASLRVYLCAALFALALACAPTRAQNAFTRNVAAALEREMIEEINFARTRPVEYATLLDQRLLNPEYKVVGVACGAHKMGPMCVITLAGGFSDKSAAATAKPAAGKPTAAPQFPTGAKRM